MLSDVIYLSTDINSSPSYPHNVSTRMNRSPSLAKDRIAKDDNHNMY